jgi:PqqD family protein of HPr-rel-A system
VTGGGADRRIHLAPKRVPWVAAVELDGETVLFDERSGRMHLLDAVATVVWQRLDGSATLDSLARDLSAAFGAGEDRVRADVTAFLRQLERERLLEGVAPAAPER